MRAEPAPSPNILVVDDTLANLRLLGSVLGDEGYDVRQVTNGRLALLAAERKPPDLILLDINMPEMNGYEVCARLKEKPELRDVPVIFLTATTDTADKVKAFGVGGVDYVTKPFQFEELLARVKTHLSLRQALRELEQCNQRQRDLERLRDDLVHMVVHDMRSPLTCLIADLALLERHPERTIGSAAEVLGACTDAAGVLSRMANDLLDVSRLEAGRLPLDLKLTDLVELAQEVRTTLDSLRGERTLSLDATGPLKISCDPAIIRRVLENLVSNGIKHTPPRSHLCLSVVARDARARVLVQDDGPGIPPEARGRIFEKFASLTPSPDPAFHSAGLGLAFCKLAIEAHGGTIGVDPAEPRGSIFWFELPG